MNKLKIFLNKFKREGDGPLFGFGTSPQADWRVIFFTSVGVAVLVSIINIAMFIGIDRGEIFVTQNPQTEGNKTLDIEKLKSTNRFYQNKATEFEKIKSGTRTSLVDPSI